MHGRVLTALYQYPIKSLGAVARKRAEVGERGLALDRRWMLVDEQGRFLSQRTLPRMARVRVALSGEGLRVSAAGMQDLYIPVAPLDGAALYVQVWNDRCEARLVGRDADRWLSQFLGRPCRLVYMPEGSVRPVRSAEGTVLDARMGFADSAPLLLVNEASLADLNARLARPVPVYRFRPNLVVSGQAPYEEDRWRRLRIGGTVFQVIKPCSRCPVITVEPGTGEFGAEPLATLGGYRRSNGKVHFGIKLLREDSAAGPTSLTAGDAVEVLDEAGARGPRARGQGA